MLKFLFGFKRKPMALPSKFFDGEDNFKYSWEDFDADMRKYHPIRYFLSETLSRWLRVSISMRIEHWWYWLRTHTYNRYHILDLRAPEHGYCWGWTDVDRKMVIANFKFLCEFVEKEEPFENIDWEDNPTHSAVAKEFMELYRWWNEDHPKILNSIDRRRDIVGIENEMLIRLIKIREYLWT